MAAQESGVERGRKKERLIQLLHESSAAPCLLTRYYLACVMLANHILHRNEYSLEGTMPAQVRSPK